MTASRVVRRSFLPTLAILLAAGGSCTSAEEDFDACHDMRDNDEDGATDCRDKSCRATKNVCLDTGQLRYVDHLRKKLAGLKAVARDMPSFKKELTALESREKEIERKAKRFGLPLSLLLEKTFPENEIEVLEQSGSGVEACALLSATPDPRRLQRIIRNLKNAPLLASPTKIAIGPMGWRLQLRFFPHPEKRAPFADEPLAAWRSDPIHGEEIRELETAIERYERAIGELVALIEKRRLAHAVITGTNRADSIRRAMRRAVRLLFTGPNPLATGGKLVIDTRVRELIRIRVDAQPAGVYDGDAWNRRLRSAFRADLATAGDRVQGHLVPVADSFFGAARRADHERLSSFLSAGMDVNAIDHSGKTALHFAALSGDPKTIELLVDSGADVEARTREHIAPAYNPTPMFFVSSREAAQALRANGARVDAEHAAGLTPLHHAAYWADADTVRWFLAQGVAASSKNRSGFAPIHAACETKGRSDIVRALLEAGAEVDTRTRSGTTALHIAAREGNTESVRVLLDCGADPNARNRRAETPILFAQGAAITRLLLARDADPDSIDQWRRSALIDALIRKDDGKLKVLLKEGASLALRDKMGRTPMHFVAAFADPETAELLHDRGAAIDVPDDKGAAPLLAAIGRRHDDVATWLIDRGAKVDRADEAGCAAVHVAAFRADPRTLGLLAEHGAAPQRSTARGVSPLHIAVLLGHRATAAWLLERGADPEKATKNGLTPLALAVFRADAALVRLLVARGADPTGVSATTGSPLHLAAMWWPAGTTALLSKKVSDVDTADAAGNTPLHLAVVSKKKQAVAALLHAGADPNHDNHRGQTPLHAAAIAGDTAILHKLLERGGEPNALDETQLAPLHGAVRMGHAAAVELLLERGARAGQPAGAGWDRVLIPRRAAQPDRAPALALDGIPEILHCAEYAAQDAVQGWMQKQIMIMMTRLADRAASILDLVARDAIWKEIDWLPRKRVSPLHVAALLGQREICGMLIARGADIDATTGAGQTPLFLAAAEGRATTVERLLELGADPELADAAGRKPIDVARAENETRIVKLLAK